MARYAEKDATHRFIMKLVWLTSQRMKQAAYSSVCADLSHLLSELNGSGRRTTMKRLTSAIRHSHVLVAADGATHQIVGTATLVPIHRLGVLDGRVEEVVVLSSHRGRGIGRLLMKEVIRRAKKLGIRRLHLTSRPVRVAAHQLYKSLGFTEKETTPFILDL